MKWLCLLLLFCIGCSGPSNEFESLNTQEIVGREPEKIPLYRLKVPTHWKCERPLPDESLVDTRKALCSFVINDAVKVTIHNFPAETLDQRIPPLAQLQRWKQQLKDVDPMDFVTIPQSFSGYVGLLLEGPGIMAWSLQLGRQQFRSLSDPQFPMQMRADITIKVTGPAELIKEHRSQILATARSFELIEEIPLAR